MQHPSVEQVRDLLGRHLPDRPVGDVVALGEGLDNVAFAADDLVVRVAKEPDPAAVRREARVLEVAGRVSPVPVPAPVLVLPDLGCLAYPRLPGVPLLHARGTADPVAVARVLAGLLHALHAVPVAEVADVVDDDGPEPLAVWRDDAVEQYAVARPLVPEHARPRVEAFLGAAPPADPRVAVLSHNDLGIEHVLVDPATGRVTGVIDWTDAGPVDPAADCGRVRRDLGPAALDVVLTRLGPHLAERSLFYARCMVLEDMAHGRETGQREYVDKSLDALDTLFPPAHRWGASPEAPGNGGATPRPCCRR